MEVNEEEINRILGAMFTNSIDIGKFKKRIIHRVTIPYIYANMPPLVMIGLDLKIKERLNFL